eukprot:COSAG01_NODE_41459_length_451_cov_1.002841_1_plen_20_part_01
MVLLDAIEAGQHVEALFALQ